MGIRLCPRIRDRVCKVSGLAELDSSLSLDLKKSLCFILTHHLRLQVGQGFWLKEIYPIPYYILPENYTTTVLVPGRLNFSPPFFRPNLLILTC